MYYYGQGVPKNYCAEAVKWFRKAAEQGDVDAEKAGRLHVLTRPEGRTLHKYPEAAKWYLQGRRAGLCHRGRVGVGSCITMARAFRRTTPKR